jgi:transcriptional regulator with XRE-family HTH domain
LTTDAAAYVAKSVSAYRLIRKLSQADLAERCGISRQGIDRIERGLAMPSLKMLEKLAAAFEVAPSELLP